MEGMNAQGIQRRRVSRSHPSKTCRLPNVCIPRAVCLPELSTYEAIDKLIIQQEVCMFSMDGSGIYVCAGCPERSCFPCDTPVSCFPCDTPVSCFPCDTPVSCFLCDMSCIMVHAICLVSCFMRYALYHASCDLPCIMLHAICLVSCFMRFTLYHASCEKPVLYEGLALGHI